MVALGPGGARLTTWYPFDSGVGILNRQIIKREHTMERVNEELDLITDRLATAVGVSYDEQLTSKYAVKSNTNPT